MLMSLLKIYLLIGIITFVIIMIFLSVMIVLDSICSKDDKCCNDDTLGLWICTIPLVSLYCGMLWIFVLIDFIVFLIVNRKEL